MDRGWLTRAGQAAMERLDLPGEVACLFLLAGVRGELPFRSAGDAGMVPLSLRMAAKGGEQGTQLAALRQVSPVLQRIRPRAKWNQIPGSMHS